LFVVISEDKIGYFSIIIIGINKSGFSGFIFL